MASTQFEAQDLSRFRREGETILALAMALGWDVRWASNRNAAVAHWHGVGDDFYKVVVPVTNIRDSRSRSMLMQILRHSKTEDIADLAYGTRNISDMPPSVQRAVGLVGVRLRSWIDEQRRNEEVPALTHKVAEAISPDRLEVSRTPIIVGGKRADRYESGTTVLVTYSDGSTAFGCKHCDYTHDNRRTVSAHSGKAHPGAGTDAYATAQPKNRTVLRAKHREAEVFDLDEVVAEARGEGEAKPMSIIDVAVHGLDDTPLEPAPPRPPLVGMNLLSHVIRVAMAKPKAQARDVAVALLDASFDERARMAMLILSGREFEQMRFATEEAIAIAREKQAAAEAQRDKVTNDLRALKAILKDVGDD